MNKTILIGRLTKDPELKFTTGSGIAVASFTLAVDRPYTNQNGQKEADFIPIVCWRKLAETVANHCVKGQQIAVSGSIQVRKYQAQDRSNRYATEVIADSVQFLGNKVHAPADNLSGDEHIGFTPVEGDDIPF